MLKSFYLIAVLSAASILFIAKTASSHPLTTGSKYPVVPSSDTDKLACYMQTVDGRTLNLDSLCGNSEQSRIVISNVWYSQDLVMGRVVNKTGKTVNFAKVNYEAINRDGNVIERGSISTEPSTLIPNQSAMFQIFTRGDINVRTTSVEWNE